MLRGQERAKGKSQLSITGLVGNRTSHKQFVFKEDDLIETKIILEMLS